MSIGSNKGLTPSEIRKKAKLYSGKYGSKQGKKIIQSVTIKDEDYNPKKPISSINKPTINVAPNYRVNGVKAKNLKEGVVVNESKYGKARGRHGGGIGRIPKDVKREKLEPVGSISRNFKVIADKNDPNNQSKAITKETKGFDVKAKTPTDLANKVDESLTKTSIGKDIKQEDKEFKEAPEFQRNQIKQQNKPKYTKGSRTVMQVIENADVKANNTTSKIKEGSRKRYREIKKKLKINN